MLVKEEVSEIREKEYGMSCCVATSYCEPANCDARRCKNRFNFYFCVVCVVSNQSGFSKKACESTKGVI